MSKLTIVKDLAAHLNQKVETALQDYFDRCSDMEIDREDAMALALTVLGTHLTIGAVAIEATEREFVHMCRWHFHRASHDG